MQCNVNSSNLGFANELLGILDEKYLPNFDAVMADDNLFRNNKRCRVIKYALPLFLAKFFNNNRLLN